MRFMYYRYEIMEVLITSRSGAVEIKVNPAFYLPLEMVLRFYFVQVRETRGSIIIIVRPTDLSLVGILKVIGEKALQKNLQNLRKMEYETTLGILRHCFYNGCIS